MTQEQRQTWDSVAHVISRMRDRVSLPKASKEFGVATNVVIKLAGRALRKKHGRYVATKTDRLLRVLNVLSVKGKTEIAFRDSRQASVVGSHWAAVQKYLQTGDSTTLQGLRNTRVTDARGKRHRLFTDLAEIERLGSAGILSFESLYGGVR
jgi:hypothetical protein